MKCGRDWSAEVCSSDLGGTLTVNTGATASTGGGTFSGGTLAGTGTFTVAASSGTYTWSGGSRSGERGGGEEGKSRGWPGELKKKRGSGGTSHGATPGHG